MPFLRPTKSSKTKTKNQEIKNSPCVSYKFTKVWQWLLERMQNDVNTQVECIVEKSQEIDKDV